MTTNKPSIGHNSGMTTEQWDAFERSEGMGRKLTEGFWRLAERQMAVNERNRLIRNGTIRPGYRPVGVDFGYIHPQLMVKNEDGSWSPQIKVVGHA